MSKFSKTRDKFNDMVFLVTIMAAVAMVIFMSFSHIRKNADSISVTADMSSLSPNPLELQFNAQGQNTNSATASLSAYYSPPNDDSTFDEDNITEEYSWSVDSVQYSATYNGNYQTVSSGYTCSINPQSSSNSGATLTFTPQIAGYWQISIGCLVIVTDPDTDQQWTGSGDAGGQLTSYIINILYTGDVIGANGTAPSYSSTNNGSTIATSDTLNVQAGWPISTVSVQVSPTDQTTTYQWSVAGSSSAETAIKNFEVASDDSYGKIDQLLSSDLTAASLPTFHFVDDSSHNVSCTATVDGQQFTAQTTFSVTKPSTNMTANYQYSTQYCIAGQGPADYLYLEASVAKNPSLSNQGILFSYQQIDSNTFPGTSYFLQIYTANEQWTGIPGVQSFTSQGTGLDGSDPYGGGIQVGNNYEQGDSPYQPTDTFNECNYSSLSVHDSAKMWVMFKPALSGSIDIPLDVAPWQWGGTLTSNNAGQTWTPANLSPAAPGPASAAPTNTYPVWQMIWEPQPPPQ
ncbi:MAG TPA: hypothetical protein VMG59_02465 [Phycisphaerae bacterium]|nr:hypothetical protein [Phycisphaerae bacterium]